MLTTTQDRPTVARRDPAPEAHAITQKLLAHRKALPHALNGKPIPGAAQAAQIRKDMQQGKSAEVRRLLTVLQDDVLSGVPLPTVLSVLDDMAAFLRLAAGDLPPVPRDLAVLHRMEQRVQARLDDAQMKALARPGCAEALADVLRAADEYQAAKDKLVENVRAQVAVARARFPMEVAR